MISRQAGDQYKASGKINAQNYIIAFVLSFFASGLLGILYGFLSDLNPLIYLNFLLLFGTVMVFVFIMGFAINWSQSRNVSADFFMTLICGLFLSYNSWSPIVGNAFDGLMLKIGIGDIMHHASFQEMSIGKLGRDGFTISSEIMSFFYLTEAAALIGGPIYLLSMNKNYYCESCNKFHENTEHLFTRNNHESFNEIEKGSIAEITNETPVHKGQLVHGKLFSQINLDVCPSCKRSIVSIELGQGKKTKDAVEFSKKTNLVTGIYISENSKDSILNPLPKIV